MQSIFFPKAQRRCPASHHSGAGRRSTAKVSIHRSFIAQPILTQSHAASPQGAAGQRREPSPSPSLKEQRDGNRERQRYVRTQSMPIVSAFGPASGAGAGGSPLAQQHPRSSPKQLQQRQDSPPSPHPSLKSGAPSQQLVDYDGPDAGRGGPADFPNESNEHADFDNPQRAHSFAGTSSSSSQLQSHSPPHHQQQQQQMAQAAMQTQQQHQSAPYPPMSYTRPMARVSAPQFVYPVPVPNQQRTMHVSTGEWELNEVMADIERADFLQKNPNLKSGIPGTEGIAYAGGALSFSLVRMACITCESKSEASRRMERDCSECNVVECEGEPNSMSVPSVSLSKA